MRTLVFIISAAAILFLTTCEEESPTSTNFENSLREIQMYKLDAGSEHGLMKAYRKVYSCTLIDTTLLMYSTEYIDGDDYHGYRYGGKLVFQDIINYYDYNQYFSTGHIQSFRTYNVVNSIFLSAGDDIYRIYGKGEAVINLTSSPFSEDNPIYNI